MADRGNKPDFLFRVPSLGDPAALEVFSFEGEERLSQPFRFDVRLVSTDPQIAFADVVNKPAALVLQRGDRQVEVQGLVADFWQGGAAGQAVGVPYYSYHAVLVPRVWVLGLFYQSRVFQNMSVPDIAREVFRRAGLRADAFKFALKGTYERREYCVQYRETDLAFVMRLFEHEGIAFHFEPGPHGEVLVLTDDRSGFPAIPGEATVVYNTAGGMVTQDTETVREFVYRERVVTGRVVLSEYNYRTPSLSLLAETQGAGTMPGVFHEYGEHHKTTAEGQRLAKICAEEIEAAQRTMTGVSDCLRFRPGLTFSLDRLYRDDLTLDYVLTSVRHRGQQGSSILSGITGNDAEAHYANEFGCVPAAAPYRPPRLTPEPRLPGVITATVETGGGDYAYLDDQGRYRVRLPFDLSGEPAAKASRPVRMAQPYSGPNYGLHFPQHAGAEMVLAFVDGDVDRPIAIGSVPNPNQASPAVAANKTQNVIRTWGENELTFDDEQGKENIYLHATKDQTIDVVNDRRKRVGHDEASEVGNDRSRKVGRDEAVEVGRNRDAAVGKNETIEVGENRDISVGKNRSETVGVDATLDVGSDLTETVGDNQTTSVGKDRSISVGKNRSETVGENQTTQVGKNLVLKVGKDCTITVSKKTTLQSGDDLTISAAKKAVIDVADQLTIRCGDASIVLKKNGDVQISGKNINVKGSGNVVLKGSKIAEN